MQILNARTKNLFFLYGNGYQNEEKVKAVATMLQNKNTDFKILNYSNIMTCVNLFIKSRVEWSPCYNIIFYYSGKIQYGDDETISLCSVDKTSSLDDIYLNIKAELADKNNDEQLSETKLKLIFIIDSYDGSLKEDDNLRYKITLNYLKNGSKLPKCSYPYGVMTLPRPFNNVSIRDSIENNHLKLSPFTNFLINRINSIEFGSRIIFNTANILASEFWSEFIESCTNSDPSFLIKVGEEFIDIHDRNDSELNEIINQSIKNREFKILSSGNDPMIKNYRYLQSLPLANSFKNF
ncbi:hypothetical protein DICPUDRAFT_83032 [Dictyostelium purpureum]|uniref:Uncharacterized protein n=1 Tax=Dictyostelium purpureum TaxID=5786 RepID=F0ZYC2_DICPU|nr:uncharacterized protein DICPUDRAFT_83032 [Dictyostelium purpureum]EGC31060.1 hypothetical protein DICPUDRAFT_83032 [Dictyostelium purpureum]|eukprot:XP_003292419.1 hypothetical protein DICPUDRAFT_83032 [Dictyostelium purpureum]